MICRRPALSDAAVADPQQAKLGRWRFARWALRMQRLLDSVDEIVGLAVGAARFERHVARGAGNFAGAAGDRQHRVAGVEERPLDGDLALVQGERPEALPGLADRAEANALVRAHLVLVIGIVHLVGEGEDVAGGVALIPGVDDGVGIGVFHHFDFLRLRQHPQKSAKNCQSLEKPPADTRKSSCPRACGTGSDAEIGKLDQIPLWYLIFVRRR